MGCVVIDVSMSIDGIVAVTHVRYYRADGARG